MPLLGILHLATNLAANNIEVQVCDLIGLPEEKWFIPEGDLYGISFSTPQTALAARCIKLLRSRTAHPIKVVAGGFHPSALPQWTLDKLGFDHVFVGEADHALVDFVKADCQGAPIITCAVPALATIPPLRRDFIDMRSFHGLGINQYVLSQSARSKTRYEGYLQTGRGCAFDCAFCAQKVVTQRKTRYYPIPWVLQQLDELLGKWECDLIYVQDDTFNISKKHVLELCEHFKQRHFTWHCLARADLLDEETAKAMKGAGCANITFGYESGSPVMLKAMNKGETVEDSLCASEIVRRVGMGIRGQLIVGFPGETDDTIQETLSFMRQVRAEKWGIHAFVPLPGSSSWVHAQDLGITIPSDEDFSTGYASIGRLGEWDRIIGNEAQSKAWIALLREEAGRDDIGITPPRRTP